jgi:hypothetical protein
LHKISIYHLIEHKHRTLKHCTHLKQNEIIFSTFSSTYSPFEKPRRKSTLETFNYSFFLYTLFPTGVCQKNRAGGFWQKYKYSCFFDTHSMFYMYIFLFSGTQQQENKKKFC